MSDPIAAAEAANKARDIANRFETAVFLIAYGIAEKDGLYEADPHRYPYSQAFRHGMNILAALCAECSDDAEELLPTFNESDFIRNSAASDVREWTARWRDECREAVEGCRSIEIGPLASVDGDYFAATSECYEVLRFAENDLLGGHQERRVYEFLRAGTQEQYVYGRRMLIRHPLLTWNEYVRIKTGLALGDPDPLDQGEADTIDPVWLQEFVSMAYEPVPGAAKVCPNCGWTMTMRGKQPHCSSATCAKAVTGDFDKLDSVAHDAFRLSRGVMHYISSPGKLELAIAEAAAGLGLKYEMWPLKDTCDILIHLPDGRQLAVDAKAYGRAERLAREIEDDTGIAQMCARVAVRDLMRQLGFVPEPARNSRGIDISIPAIGLKVYNSGNGKARASFPYCVRQDMRSGAVTVYCPLLPDGSLPYWRALIEFARLSGSEGFPDSCKRANGMALKRMLHGIVRATGDRPELLLVNSYGRIRQRDWWPGISDSGLESGPLSYGPTGYEEPLDLAGSKLRILRIRSGLNGEVPDWFTDEVAAGGADDGTVPNRRDKQGLFKMDGYFLALAPRPGDAQYKWSARGSKYDSPTAAFCEKTINEYCLLSPGGEAEALASVKYAEALRGCMVQLYKNDMRVNLPAPLHLAEQVEEYIWDWELTGRR